MLTLAARLGLVARGVFYLLLGYLAVRVAANGSGPQVDPNGALRSVARQPFGEVLIALAAAGLAAFAVTRVVTGVTTYFRGDGWRPTLRASGEGVAYAGLSVVTVLFLIGPRDEGSEQSHRTFTARLLEAPAGRVLVAAIGVGVVAFYLYQLGVAITRGFESDLDDRRMPRIAQLVAAITGSTGITARVVAFLPVGAFLIVAAVTYDADKAMGLDGSLRDAAGSWWGLLLLLAVAAGFTAYAIYSFLEAAYRKVDKP